jgi:SAM-dependent methyltransferase
VSGPSPAPFDAVSDQYASELAQGLALSGESRDYFARRRIAFLAERLRDHGVAVADVLDFGCGDGASSDLLLEAFGATHLVGVDSSSASLALARERQRSPRARFVQLSELRTAGEFDLAYCNGVFHHVVPEERVAAAARVRSVLRPKGVFSFWENNPWNPGARMVMRRIPFDRDAVPISPPEGRRLLRQAGFEVLETRYLFVFPRALRRLRGLELPLSRWPLGAQYQILARRAT